MPSRFSGPSDAIDMDKLEHETQKLMILGLVVAVLFHAALGAYFMYEKTIIRIVKPPTMELVIRRPRMKKPFVFKKKRVRKKVMHKKKITQRKPTAEIQTKKMKIMDMDFKGTVISYEFTTDIDTGAGQDVSFTEVIDIDVKIAREPEKRISMKDELISLEDLDTGQYKALVIQDPSDKKKIKGFVYIATAWGAELKPPDHLKRAVIALVEAVKRYTNINAKTDTHLYLDSPKLFETPFVYITTDSDFELTEIERKNFGEYLRSGGFAVLDNALPEFEYGMGEASLRQMLKDSLGADAKFLPIPNDHPLYHCFFDFDDGPPQGSEVQRVHDLYPNTAAFRKNWNGIVIVPGTVIFLEGIWINNRLVAIYSDKGYAHKWSNNPTLGPEVQQQNEPQLKMGVNMVVFALTQSGSIAQQRMELYSDIR